MLALGQDVDLSLLNGVSGLEIKVGVVQVGSGIFVGGDMVPAERAVSNCFECHARISCVMRVASHIHHFSAIKLPAKPTKIKTSRINPMAMRAKPNILEPSVMGRDGASTRYFAS